jgi:hypothetical protein
MSSRKLEGLSRERSKSIKEGEGVIKSIQGICISPESSTKNKKHSIAFSLVVMSSDGEGNPEKIPVFASAEPSTGSDQKNSSGVGNNTNNTSGGKKEKKSLYVDEHGNYDEYTIAHNQLLSLSIIDTKAVLPQLCWVEVQGVYVTRKVMPESVMNGVTYPKRTVYYVNASTVSEAMIPENLLKGKDSKGKSQREILIEMLCANWKNPNPTLYQIAKESIGSKTTIPLLLHGSNRWTRLMIPEGSDKVEWLIPSVYNVLRHGIEHAFCTNGKTYYDVDQPQVTVMMVSYDSKKVPGKKESTYLFDFGLEQFKPGKKNEDPPIVEGISIEDCGIWNGVANKLMLCVDPEDCAAQELINTPQALVFVKTKGGDFQPVFKELPPFKREDVEWERDLLKPTSSVFNYFQKNESESDVSSVTCKFGKIDKKSSVEVPEVIPLHEKSLREQGEGLLIEMKHGKHILALLAERAHMSKSRDTYGKDPDSTYVYSRNVRSCDYTLIKKDNKWNAEKDAAVRNLKELGSIATYEKRIHDETGQVVHSFDPNLEIRARLGYYGQNGKDLKKIYKTIVMPDSPAYGKKSMYDILVDNQQLDANNGQSFTSRDGRLITKNLVLFQNLLLVELFMLAYAHRFLESAPSDIDAKRYSNYWDKMFTENVASYAKVYEITDYVLPTPESIENLADFAPNPYVVKIPSIHKLKRKMQDTELDTTTVEPGSKISRIEDDIEPGEDEKGNDDDGSNSNTSSNDEVSQDGSEQ